MKGLGARPLNIVGYGEEDEGSVIPGEAEGRDPGSMNTDRSDTDSVGVMGPGSLPDGVGRDDGGTP
jgi:hypothetical protein